MSKNKFSSRFKANLNRAGWEGLCLPNQFRVLDVPTALGYGLIPPGMDGVNSVIVGASGSTSGTIMYFSNICRIDGSEIDQEPYFELFQCGSMTASLYGIFHHPHFTGRTETLSHTNLDLIAASGSTADISFTSKPDSDSGSLEDLRKAGKINGFDYTYSQGMRKHTGNP